MPRKISKKPISMIGIDIAKNTFHLIGLDEQGSIVLQSKLSRSQLGRWLGNVPHCLIGMEACPGAHHIGCMLEDMGHDVRLIPAQYFKPFLKGHKNDYRDAEAIADRGHFSTEHIKQCADAGITPTLPRAAHIEQPQEGHVC